MNNAGSREGEDGQEGGGKGNAHGRRVQRYQSEKTLQRFLIEK